MDKNLVVMISGVTGGIGGHAAQQLLDAGWRLSMGSRNMERAKSVIPESSQALHVAYDACDPAAAKRWVQQTEAAFGRIDAIVNAAGILLPFELDHSEEAEQNLDQMWNINVKAPLRVVREALPTLIQSACAHVVNVASLSGVRPGNTGTGYAMTKSALIALTQMIRIRHWEDGIRSTALCPGAVDTGMIADIRPQLSHSPSDPADIARAILFLLSLPKTSSVALFAMNSRPDSLW